MIQFYFLLHTNFFKHLYALFAE